MAGRRFRGHEPEVGLRLGIHLQGCQEGHVKVARGEPEGAAFVVAHDGFDVLGAELAGGPAHSRNAVVVTRNRQGPAAGHGEVVFQQARGRHRREEGIAPLIDHVINAHVSAPGGAGELPQPCSAHFGIGSGVEGRLHVGQSPQFRGELALLERLGDEGSVFTGAHQAGLEAVRLAQLEANMLGRSGESFAGDVCGPLPKNMSLVRRQSLPLAARQGLQNSAIVLLPRRDLATPGAAAGSRGERERLIDHA